MLSSIALRRLRLISLAHSGVDRQKKLTFLSELAGLGYALENPEDYDDSVLYDYDRLVADLKAMRGGQVDYVPLFQGFPGRVPEDKSYFVDRLIGMLVNHCLDYPRGTRLESGLVVPDWLFELEQFGADPISQMQDPKLFAAGVERQKKRDKDTHVEWVNLRFAEAAEVEARALEFLQNSLYARSSLQETLRPDLEWLLAHFSADKIDFEKVVFRETRTYLTQYYWKAKNWEMVAQLVQTPTDFLRLFAALEGCDVSLADKIKYPKLSRLQRRLVLTGLERAPRLEEDLKRYPGLWLAVGRGLHPGEVADKFPKTAAAFHTLRNGTLRSSQSAIEMAFQQGRSREIIPLLKQSPSLLARRLQQLLKANLDQGAEILAEFGAVAEQVPLKNLLILQSYFAHLSDSPYRTTINKKGKVRVTPRPPGDLPGSVVTSLLEVLERAVKSQLVARSSWSQRRCWIDPLLRNYTVPLQQRKASEGMLTLGRGTRLPLDSGKVLRLFVYWKERSRRTDLDLSVIQFDDAMSYVGQVSYTRLRGDGITHSGDLQSAPQGAAEFIDIDLAYLRSEQSCRYLAPQVFRYAGDAFPNMDCHAGWMIRDRVDGSYESFDLKTVQNKFDLTGTGSYCLPILVDLKACQIIYVDLYVASVDSQNRVEGAVGDISIIMREMVRMGDRLPNLYDLAVAHQQARGAIRVPTRKEADLTFGLSACDYSADRVEKILAELL